MIHVPSGRVYIGQHKLPKGKTPENDNYFGSGKVWKKIYNKYSNECVKVVLDFADTIEEANELERKYIAHYKAVYGGLCVNISEGGRGVRGIVPPMLGKKHSEETRRKMSEAHRGKKFSEEARKNMSLSRTGEKNHNFGKHFSSEHRAKIAEAEKKTKRAKNFPFRFNNQNKTVQ